ncbi:MAG: GNAT family N-acetyltransferase [Anaerolineaceae bacterium]
MGNVATHPDWQRNGIAHVLVRVAGEALRKSGCAFAMLFCEEKLLPYYEKCGYHRVESPLFIRSEGRRLEIHEVMMAIPLAGEEWPEGEIDLLGLPW